MAIEKSWREEINEITAPYLLPQRKVYIVPKDIWQQCLNIYEGQQPEQRPGETRPAFTALAHPNNHYPILVFNKYLFIDLGV